MFGDFYHSGDCSSKPKLFKCSFTTIGTTKGSSDNEETHTQVHTHIYFKKVHSPGAPISFKGSEIYISLNLRKVQIDSRVEYQISWNVQMKQEISNMIMASTVNPEVYRQWVHSLS